MRASQMNLDTVLVASVVVLPVLLLAATGVGLIESRPSTTTASASGGMADADYSEARTEPELPGGGSGWGDALGDDGAPHYVEYEAWYDGDEYDYYDLGTNTSLDGDRVAIAKVWAFVEGFEDDGTPRFIPDHASLFDVVPGQEGYSDLWDAQLVVVTPGYDSSWIHSLADLEASGLEVVPAGMLVDCPIVPPGSSIEDGRALRHGWSRGEPVVYYHFGVASATPMRTWVPITGFDGNGRPVRVPGQYPVIEFAPGEPGYSPFQLLHYVTVDDRYEANELRSAEDVAASGYAVTPTQIMLNRPVPRD